MALSLTLIQHSPGIRLIALWSTGKNANVPIPIICTFKFWVEHAHTWRLYETKLACYMSLSYKACEMDG